MLPSDSFMPGLDSLLGYSTGEFQALQLIVFVEFYAWINHFDILENNFFIVFDIFYLHLNTSQNNNVLFSFTLFSYLK